MQTDKFLEIMANNPGIGLITLLIECILVILIRAVCAAKKILQYIHTNRMNIIIIK